jgi:hypothetical protein
MKVRVNPHFFFVQENYNLVILSNNDWTIYEDANYDHHPDRRKIKTGPKIVIHTVGYLGPVIIENFISGSGVVVCYNRKHFISLSYTNKQIMETIINEVNLMSSLEKVLFIFWSFCVISFCLLLMGSVFIAVYDKMRRMTSNTPKSKFGQNIWRYRI